MKKNRTSLSSPLSPLPLHSPPAMRHRFVSYLSTVEGRTAMSQGRGSRGTNGYGGNMSLQEAAEDMAMGLCVPFLCNFHVSFRSMGRFPYFSSNLAPTFSRNEKNSVTYVLYLSSPLLPPLSLSTTLNCSLHCTDCTSTNPNAHLLAAGTTSSCACATFRAASSPCRPRPRSNAAPSRP